MDIKELDGNARAMVAAGKGILAADESTGTIKKRFDKIGLESSFESRRAYRELLFTAPEAEKHISGVILYDETLRQQTATGQPFPQLLASRGILAGIKVDAGAKLNLKLSGGPQRHYLIWFTDLPADGDGYRIGIAEAGLRS